MRSLFSDSGYREDQVNGLILKSYPDLIVKTPNGSIKINKIRLNQAELLKGKIFK